MKLILCFLAILLSITTSSKVFAAFPIQQETTLHSGQNIQSTERPFNPIFLKLPPKRTDNVAVERNTPGLLSFIFSIAGFIALFTGPGAILTPILGIAGIVLGAIGLRKAPRGLAIAGLAMGIVDIVAFIIYIIILAFLLLSFWSGFR